MAAFYEEDEPVDTIRKAFERGKKVHTRRPVLVLPLRTIDPDPREVRASAATTVLIHAGGPS